MAILAKGSEGGDFKLVPEGTHLARCVTVVDCGMQKTEWQGQEKWQHKVWIAFEVPAVRVEWTKDEKEHEGPAIIGKLYTNNIGDKAHLGQHLASWRGKSFTGIEIRDGFDVGQLLDKPCQISVTHNDKGERTYANITGIMGLPAGVEVPERETPLTLYDPDSSEASKVFDSLPKWLQEKVTFGHNLGATNGGMTENPVPQEKYTETEFNDDIPF